jgi:cytidylate kinase
MSMTTSNHGLLVEKLVSRQVRQWEILRQARKECAPPGRGMVDGVCYGPYLLVSRERGSGGLELARRVGERLGWQVFDKVIVDEIARHAKVRQWLVESLDERVRSTFEDMMQDFLSRPEISPQDYLYHLRHIMLMLGHQGEVVVVGRGAEHMLPRQYGLCLRAVAPLGFRVRRLATTEQMTLEAAREDAETTDQKRTDFVRRHFGGDVANPLHYDLIVNTGEMSMEDATEIVLRALERKLGVTPRAARAAAKK